MWPCAVPLISDESDVSKEVILVWRQNVFCAEGDYELQTRSSAKSRVEVYVIVYNRRVSVDLLHAPAASGLRSDSTTALFIRKSTPSLVRQEGD